MNYERSATLDRHLTVLTVALKAIANYGDCIHFDHPDDGEPPCTCPVCVAKAALECESGWRYMGHRYERVTNMPREAAIVDAWRRYFSGIGSGTPDHKLEQIIGSKPSERDWFIASTIVQWLATNVGQCTLSDAGYHYQPPEAKP